MRLSHVIPILALCAAAASAGPSIEVISPIPGARITAATRVIVVASAYGDTITRVCVELDGRPVGSDTPPAGTVSGGFSIALDTHASDAGPHVLTATATGAKTGRWISAPLPVFLVPTAGVTIAGPHGDPDVTGVPHVEARPASAAFTARVDWYLDGRLIQVQTAAPYAFDLDTTSLTNASHTLRAVLTDLSGNMAAASVSFSVANDNANLTIGRLYRILLERPADPNGLAYWRARYFASFDGFGLGLEMMRSAEGRAVSIARLYRQFLHRPPEPSAVLFHLASLQAGATLQQLRLALVTSTEYANRTGGSIDAVYVTALYNDVLERAVDPSAGYWVSELAHGTPRAVVARRLLDSAEARRAIARGIATRSYGKAWDYEVDSVVQLLDAGRSEDEVTVRIALDIPLQPRP